MGSIQILLGKTRVRRRRAVARGELSGVDRYGRPNFLYVTDTVRKARVVADEFLNYRDGAAFLPTVTTASGLMADLATRHGDGRACWTTAAAALVAERLLVEEHTTFPWLAALGDPERVGAAAAELAGAWDEAERPELDARPELSRFLARLLERLAADRARRPVGDALRLFLERLGRPNVSLTQWLAAHHAVIVDDVLHPSPLRRRVWVGLARAWQALGAHVVFSFESGRDLGGAEAARFFEYADDDLVAFPLRPFQATRAFRRALFADLVAEGGEAELVVAGHAETRAIEPGEEPGAPEPSDLADRLYADAPEEPDAAAGCPRLVRYADPAAEVRAIAHAVKDRLAEGIPPQDLWVAFPGLPGYLPLVRRIFGELGIPVETSAGRPVRARPIADLLVVAARSATVGHPLPPLLAALASGLIGAVSGTEAVALARACREKGIVRGAPDTWRERLGDEAERHAAALAALADTTARLAPLADPVTPELWRDTLLGLVEAWGVYTHANAASDPETRSASLSSLGRALECVEGAARQAAAVDAGVWDPARLARLLEAELEATRLPDIGIGPRRVQVVGMLELRGIHPPWLWIGGLLADDFPGRPPEDFLLPRVARRALDRLDPGDEARYLFASALRNALAEGHTLTLSWPAARDDRPVAVSPLLEDLLEVTFDGAELRERVETGVPPTCPAGPEELDTYLGEARARGVPAGAWLPFTRAPDRLAEIAAVVDARRDPTTFGPWDGVLDRAPTPRALGVTRFEEYLACPARYFHHAVLRLDAEATWDPDLPRSEQGRLLHGILEDFLGRVRAGGLPHLRGLDSASQARWAATLHEVARARMAAEPLVLGLPAPVAGWHDQRWLAGLLDTAPKGLLAAWLDAEVASTTPTTLDRTEVAFEGLRVGSVSLQGRVDRVDRLENGSALVIDYKTGKAPDAAAVRAGLKIQGFVYLEALGSTERGAAVYQELRGAAKLASAGWLGDAETLETLGAPSRQAIALDDAERDRIRTHLADAAGRLASGVFHTTLAGPKHGGCGWCELRRVCRVDHVRNAAVTAHGDPRWQAPLEPLPTDEDEVSA